MATKKKLDRAEKRNLAGLMNRVDQATRNLNAAKQSLSFQLDRRQEVLDNLAEIDARLVELRAAVEQATKELSEDDAAEDAAIQTLAKGGV